MALAIKKFANGGSSEVRTYKRGNDEVDLNEFVRLAEAGFNDWLDKTDIKEKHKKEVRAAYQDMITRINNDPESFVARLGGGFTNTAGITNKTKGFDAYGIAAGYLGNTLRGMSVYTKPEVKSDKPKYNRNSGLITTEMLSQIWGDNPDNFVRLDAYDEATGLRGITNRVALSVAGLGALRDNLSDYYEFDSEEDKQHAIDRINSVIAKLLNTDPNDDWFSLGQLGATGIDRFFFTGNILHPTSPQSSEEQALDDSKRRSKKFEQWVSSTYPKYTGTLHGTVALVNSNDLPVSNAALTEFKNKFNSFSNDDLKKWMLEYISNIDSYDINNNQFMRRIYPSGIPNFNTGQVIATILNRMKENGMLYLFSSDSTKYYIPGTSRQGAGYVWDSDPNVNALYHVDIHDIPYWQLRITNEFSLSNSQVGGYAADPYWSRKYPGMYKDGGILKAQLGIRFNNILDALTYLPEDLTDDKRLRNVYSNGTFTLQNRTRPATDLVNPGNNQYDPELGGVLLEQLDYYRNWLNILTTNPTVAEAYARRYRALQPTTNVHYRQWFNDDDSFNFKQFVESAINNKRVYNDSVNGIGHDFYRGRVYLMVDKNGLPLEGYYNALQDGYKVIGDPELDSGNLAYVYKIQKEEPEINGSKLYPLVGEPDEPIDGSDFNEVTGDVTKQQDNTSKVDLNETYIKLKGLGLGLNWLNLVREIGPNLLGASRLTGSILTNNKIARTVRDSIRPKVHDDYWLFSPVTGAFGEMQLRNRQGAEVLSLSHKPFTSDASLASARMLEGLRLANNLQHLGFLADNREIRRTQAEALQRQESNIARHSKLANDDIDAIITNNQTAAQLEASRLKQNRNSINNYLLEGEGRMRQRLAEDKDRYNQFLLQTGLFSALQKRKHNINELMNAFRTYTALPGNETKTLTDFNNYTAGRYEQAIAAINTDYEMSQLANFGRVYGYGFTPPEDYVPYDRNKYNLTVRSSKNGGSIKLNSSQLIDKIIRKNESNS